MKRLYCLFLLSLFLFQSENIFAGAWTSGQGHMYNKFAINYFTSSRQYDDDGDKHKIPFNGKFHDFNLNWYEEYGVIDNMNLITSVYYKWLTDENRYIESKSNGISDIDIGIKYNLIKNPVVLSVQGLFKLEGPYDIKDMPSLGNGQNDFELKLLLGKSLERLPIYFGLEAGYRWRFEDPSDEWRVLLEVGGSYQDFYGRLKVDSIISARNADERDRAVISNISMTPQFDLTKLDMTIGYNIDKKWAVEASYTPTIYGENTTAGYTMSAALIFSF